MKKCFIIASLVGSFAIFADSTDLYDSFFMFALFGIIPGQNIPINASIMLAGYIAVAVMLLVLLLAPTALLAIKSLLVVSKSNKKVKSGTTKARRALA